MDMEDDRDDNPPYFHRRTNSYDINSRIMLTAIISLSMVVILVTILHVYARFVLRRQARRRAALGQLGITTITQVHPVEAPKTGLDPSTIALLPLLVFKDRDRDRHDDDDMGQPSKECPVCLSVFEDGEMVRVLPNCKHNFHAECIDKWLCSTSTCPICRTEAQPRLTPEAREPMVVNPEAREPLERMSTEGTSEPSAKVNGSSSRLSSFRRMLNRDRPSQRIQSCGQDVLDDLERQ